MKDHFTKLKEGHILGIIDAYGACHSVFTGEKVECHETHFPTQTHCRWRWNNRDSIFVILGKISAEDYDTVMSHLTKKYGLLWWENGHHDLDHLLKKCQEEKEAGHA